MRKEPAGNHRLFACARSRIAPAIIDQVYADDRHDGAPVSVASLHHIFAKAKMKGAEGRCRG
jgi:hypothetical protein